MSTPSPRHGAAGCPREECLTARVRLTAALAADWRDLSGLDGLEIRHVMAAPELLRRAS